MSPQNTIRDWARLIYYLSQNIISLIGVVLTTSSATTLIGFLDLRLHAAGPSAPLHRHLAFPNSALSVRVRLDSHSDRHFLAAPKIARCPASCPPFTPKLT